MNEKIRDRVLGAFTVLLTSGLTFLLSSFFAQYARTEVVQNLEQKISNL